MTDSERFIRETEAANQSRADQIDDATGSDEEDALSRRDHVYGAFVQPNVFHSQRDEDDAAAQRLANDGAQRNTES